MPAIRRNPPATTDDALNGLNFKVQNRPALVSLYASGANEGDTISFLVNSLSFLEDATANVEAASGVVDTDRDALLIREAVPAGEYRMPLTMTADMAFLLIIEPL